MEPRAGKEEVEEKDGREGGGWWVFGGRILAGRQRVSEPGSAIKSRGSRSSSAPHLSGRHAITGFVYTGLCTAGNLGEKWRMSCSRWCDVCDEQLPRLWFLFFLFFPSGCVFYVCFKSAACPRCLWGFLSNLWSRAPPLEWKETKHRWSLQEVKLLALCCWAAGRTQIQGRWSEDTANSTSWATAAIKSTTILIIDYLVFSPDSSSVIVDIFWFLSSSLTVNWISLGHGEKKRALENIIQIYSPVSAILDQTTDQLIGKNNR